MKFPSLFHKSQQHNFDSISGYNDLKNIISRALESDENFNVLLVGAPASSKTMFLMEIMKAYKDAQYFDGTNTTSRILDILEEKRPKIILLDEAEKMGRPFQNQLLNFLESGHIKVTQMRRNYDFEIKGCKVIATANSTDRLSKPLASRFRKLFLPKYSREQFLEVAAKVCPKLPKDISMTIGEEVFKIDGSVRDVISISKLLKKHDGPDEIREILSTLQRYGNQNE